jgi:hypothetical protein
MVRRLAPALTIVVLVVFAAGCREDRAREPTVPDIDFTPVLVVVVDDETIHIDEGPRQAADVSVDPPEAPPGSVVEVRNDGDADHRVVGNDGIVLDTGLLLPGESVTVVLEDVDELELREFSRPDDVVVLTVTGPDTD